MPAVTTDLNWINAALTAARPAAVGALLGYFRSLDMAEEAFQEASLRALKAWPEKGVPRNRVGWLVLVGRNSSIDGIRRRSRETALTDAFDIDDGSGEAEAIGRLDDADYADDLLRLLFICCHRDLPATQQIALALRIVSGLSVAQIARAFLVSEAAMEQRITRAKRLIANAGVPFEAPSPLARAERLSAVAAMIYLIFNEGYTAAGDAAEDREPLCKEAIRLARLLLKMFPAEPEIMGLLALLLLQQSRADARFGPDGGAVLLEDQDRTRWNRSLIDEGLLLVARAFRLRRPGRFQLEAAIAALHARAARYEDTDWKQIAALYAALEQFAPSPVVQLNGAVAVSRVDGPEAALARIEPLAGALSGYFYYHGVMGHLLQRLGRRAEARDAFNRAIALANTAAEAAQIRLYLDHLSLSGE